MKKKSVSRQFLVSYISLLLIPILISACVFGLLSKSLKNSSVEENQVFLNTLKKDFNSYILSLKRLNIEISYDENLQKLRKSELMSREELHALFSGVYTDAKTSVLSNDSVGGVYCYFPESDLAFCTETGNGVYDAETIASITFGAENPETPSDFLVENPKGGFCLLKLRDDNGVMHDTISYICPIYDRLRRHRTLAVCTVFMNMQFFEENIVALQSPKERKIALFDADGRIAFTTDSSFHVEMAERKNETYVDSDYIISFTDLDVSGWYYAVGTPKSVFWYQLNHARLLTMINVFLSLILGGICAGYLLKKNYSPLRSVVDKVQKIADTKEGSGNEYDILLSAFTKIQSEGRKNETQLYRQEKLLRRNYLTGLLQGKQSLDYTDGLFGLHFVSDQFMVTIFDVVNPEDLFKESEDMTEQERSDNIMLIISNILEETIGEYHSCYIVEENGFYVAVISINRERNDPAGDVITACSYGLQMIEKHFKLFVNTVIGREYTGSNAVSQSYREAYSCLEYARAAGMEGMLRTDDFLNEQRYYYYYYYYPVEKEVQLINALQCGAFREASEILEEIFQKNFSNAQLPVYLSQCLLLDIAGTLLKTTSDEEQLKRIAAICTETDNISKAKEDFLSVISALCEKNSISSEERAKNMADRVKSYVDEHYFDASLSVQLVGAYYDMTPYYLSKLFKDETGIGIAEYIRRVRVVKAKEILEEKPNIRFEDLAECVGFNGARALNRAFKQELGIQPSQYREQLYKKKIK